MSYVSASAFGGFVADRIGPRRMLFLALAPLAVATFLFGFTSSFVMGVALQGLMGLFAGADYAACIKIVAAWFGSSERGRALGLLSIAPSIGVTLANAIFPELLGLFDWHLLYWGLGCLTAVVALVCLFSLADSPTQGQRANDAGPAAPRPPSRSRSTGCCLICWAASGALS